MNNKNKIKKKVFGKIIKGENVMRELERHGSESGKTSKKCVITLSGEI